ncbi:unnamed protein product, partial [marine sediment metagenome]
GAEFNEVNADKQDLRKFRNGLNGGMFGDGRIWLDGFEIPLLVYDWELINGPTRGDMYVLTRAVGDQRVWEGEFLSSERAIADMMDSDAGDLFSMDGGRIMGQTTVENLCRVIKLWMRLRLFCFAPWMQVRIQNVVCRTPTGPLSPDFAETSFAIQSSCVGEDCP